MTTPKPRTRPVAAKVSPADKLVSDLEGQFFKLTEVAKIVGVSQATMRRLLDDPEVKAPSLELQQGKMRIYLYTPEDIEEIRRKVKPVIKERNK